MQDFAGGSEDGFMTIAASAGVMGISDDEALVLAQPGRLVHHLLPMTRPVLIVASLFVAGLMSGTDRAAAATYYFDTSGNDANSGLTPSTAKRTLAHATSLVLKPGDRILFQRGDTFKDSTFTIAESGTSVQPIIFSAYGTGTRPIFDGGGNFANGHPLNPAPGPWPRKGVRDPIRLTGNHIIASNFIGQQSSWAGIRIYGNDIEARQFEVRWNVAGVEIEYGSQRARVHDFVTHDNAVMNVLTSGGDDDSGAFGVSLHSDDARVWRFTSYGHRHFSYDYGVDGAAVEVYQGRGNRVHHFTARDDEAMTELGAPVGSTARTADNTFHHFLYYSLNYRGLTGVNIHGSGRGGVLRTKVHHGTIYLPASHTDSSSGGQGFVIGTIARFASSTSYSVGDRIVPRSARANGHIYEVTAAGTSASEPTWPTNNGTVRSGSVTFIDRGVQANIYNNIVHATWKSGYAGQPVDENNNLYSGYSQQQLKSIHDSGMDSVGPKSKLQLNPLVVSTDPLSRSFLRLQPGSPAVDAGVTRGYGRDLAGNPRFVGSAPDMGAYEKQP